MTDFAPAVRANTAIVLALAGASGSGKTKSALELAVGLAGERGQIAVIDTEGRRALHYADEYRFLHAEWRPPFTPKALGEMLREAERREYAVVIVDSMSDEHEGEGGLVDMAEAEYQAQIKKGWEANRAAAWRDPKAIHRHEIVRWLRQARCHVIFCLRADEKIEFQKVNGKTKVVPLGWTPITEKRLLYDVTSSMLFTPDQPGVPKPIRIFDKHKPFFPADRQVTREAGRDLARWASGSASAPAGGSAPETPADPLLARTPLEEMAERIAKKGGDEFRAWWKGLSAENRSKLRPFLSRYQGMSDEADSAAGEGRKAVGSDVAADEGPPLPTATNSIVP